MHEQHQVQHVVDRALEMAKAQNAGKVRKVTISVGEMLGFDEGCIRLYWEQMTAGTALQESELILKFISAKLLCPKCGKIFEKQKSNLECPQCQVLGKPADSAKEFRISEFVV